MQFFLSYAVVKGSSTNPFGHAYCVLSQLDPKDKNARPEVIHAIGQYGDPLDDHEWIQRKIFPGRLIGPGHLKNEHLRHIAIGGKYSHAHRTYQISAQEKDAYLAQIEKEMGHPLADRDFKDEKAFWDLINTLKVSPNPEDRAKLGKMLREEELAVRQNGGPHFNAFNRSCMSDSICRMKSVGIDTTQMEGYPMDVPSMTSGKVDDMELAYDEATGKVFWQSPLIITPKQDQPLNEQRRQQINRLQTFGILFHATREIHHRFDVKVEALADRGVDNQHLSRALAELNTLKEDLERLALYPNQISESRNKSYEKRLKQILQTCHRQLVKDDADSSLVQFVREVMDFFSQLVHGFKSFFAKQGVLIDISAFGFTQNSLHCFENMHDKIQRNRFARPTAAPAA